MESVLDINMQPNMTAEQKLTQIQYPVENLQFMLSALTKMHLDHPLTGEELTALFNTLHYQVAQISKAVQNK